MIQDQVKAILENWPSPGVRYTHTKMQETVHSALERWRDAGLIDAETAERIARFEGTRAPRKPRVKSNRYTVWVALALGAIALGSGVFLFVAAHWDGISPLARFSLALLLVALFHVIGAISRAPASGMVLNALGTVALGAAIAMTGQIFHIEQHWSGGVMLWAAGALAGWLLLRDWLQATMLAVLAPAWLVGQWTKAIDSGNRAPAPAIIGVLLLALAYLSSKVRDSNTRTALRLTGAIALLPAFVFLVNKSDILAPRDLLTWTGWFGAIGIPVAIAWMLDSRPSWAIALAAAWAIVLPPLVNAGAKLAWHAWAALGWIGLTAWGIQQASVLRINLGVTGFALTVLLFYFASVMDRLGRSLSLIVLGILFLGGGWLLERTRRRLVSSIGATE